MKIVLLARDVLRSLKYLVPKPLRALLRSQRQAAERRMLVLDRVTDWSVLRRLRPYRSEFGGRRGKYIDRFYIEAFLASCGESIRGNVAEIQSDEYTRMFGQSRVTHSDILDINQGNENRTISIDLTQTASAPGNAFDCIIFTQTLLLIRDYPSALRSLYKMLKPSGVLLVTVPGISPVVRGGLIAGEGADWWRFTARSARHVFSQVFDDSNVSVKTYGNVMTATAFLHGPVQEELTRQELEFNDPDFEVIIGAKATKQVAT
ncbi:MAG: methyltransferase domain-containing protein [Acidobacteriota bacterium]|nr:methyltransferase domain-containing protein [Acidobacteriota bacterium]